MRFKEKKERETPQLPETTLTNWEVIRRAFHYAYVGKRKFFWMGLTMLSLVTVVMGLIDPLLIRYLIDVVLVQKQAKVLPILIAIFAASKLISIAFSYFYSTGYAKFTQSIYFDIRTDLYEHLQYKYIAYFNKQEVGDLLRRLMGDVRSLNRIITVGESIFVNLFRLVIILMIILNFEWRLGLLALAFLPVYAFVQRLYIKRIRKEAEATMKSDVKLFNFFEERLSNILLVKLFSRENVEAKKSRLLGEEYAKQRIRFISTAMLVSSLIGLTSSAAVLIALWLGAEAVLAGTLTIGALIAVYTYIGQLFSPISALVYAPTVVQEALVAGGRVFELITSKKDEEQIPGEILLSKIKGQITFDQVTFAYPERPDQTILKNLTLEIAPGETIGLVGESGSGKTTFTRLLMRFYQPQKGEIYIDSNPLKKIARSSLRSLIGVVPQDNLFLPGTIRENLLFGKEGVTNEELEQAARSVGIHGLISQLDHGYDTVLGMDGRPLSAGERQRLSIVRAILTNPDIFIFDEPTAELDADTEETVKKALKKQSKNRTSLIIAHRFNTLDFVDRIFVLKNGSIIEQGTYQELLANKGEFYRLSQLQSTHS